MEFVKRPNERILIAVVNPKRASPIPTERAGQLHPSQDLKPVRANNLQYMAWTTGVCFFFLLLASIYVQLFKFYQTVY